MLFFYSQLINVLSSRGDNAVDDIT
jgi:hypothetical protein